jgi:beta-lactam-binding protein with PASTA domain
MIVLAALLAALASLAAVLEFAGLDPFGKSSGPTDPPPTVQLPVPTGPTPLGTSTIQTVPPVRGMPEGQASVILNNAGFQVRVQYTSAVDGSRVGRVVAQAPAAGSPLSRGGIVAIVVGSADGG